VNQLLGIFLQSKQSVRTLFLFLSATSFLFQLQNKLYKIKTLIMLARLMSDLWPIKKVFRRFFTTPCTLIWSDLLSLQKQKQFK